MQVGFLEIISLSLCHFFILLQRQPLSRWKLEYKAGKLLLRLFIEPEGSGREWLLFDHPHQEIHEEEIIP